MKVRGAAILKASIAIPLLLATLTVAETVSAQSAAPAAAIVSHASPEMYSLAELPDAPSPTRLPTMMPAAFVLPPAPKTSPKRYVRPTQQQKFHDYAGNAVGPVAFAGASFAGAIDQGFNFPHRWGQGFGAYGARVASNLGISMVTATAQYSMSEAFHEDTKYYRCTCTNFSQRFFHAALSSVASRRGADGHLSFSPALTISPFIGPIVAANTWIPTHDGVHLGFSMGEHNLLGQFAQDEALEFAYGGPNTLLGKIQRHLKKFSRTASQ